MTGMTISRHVISENMAGARANDEQKTTIYCRGCSQEFQQVRVWQIEGYTYILLECPACEFPIQIRERF